MENAIEATDVDGTITLRTSWHPDTDTGDWVELSVADTGRGIPAEIIDSVCKPFYTSKVNGTGLGLSIVKQVVTQHQGNLEIKSRQPAPGTEIIIHIPARAALNHPVTSHA